MRPMRALSTIVLFCLLLAGLCFAQPAAAEDDGSDDPFEGYNRAMFWFNDKVDVYFLEPVARGYHFTMPDVAETGVRNFFRNLQYPIRLVSDLVQLKFAQAGHHTLRFVVNSTFGVAGFADVAKHYDLEEHYEDFGVALGYCGVPSGPYLVLPFLGPSNIRDTFGRAVDYFLDPTFYIAYSSADTETKYALSGGLTALDVISRRSELLEAVETAKESSLDYYLFVKSAYAQIRKNHIWDNDPPEEEDVEQQ